MLLMERSEPTFVPEWLKGTTGNLNGGGSATHHSSSLHSDDHGVTLPLRNKSSLGFSDYDSSRSSVFSDRTASFYFRRSSSSNGSMLYEKDMPTSSRSYSSFNRSHRDRREKERSVSGDYRDYESSDINALTTRFGNDILRRSQSMMSGNRGEVLAKRVLPELNGSNNHKNHNGVRVSNISSIGKTMFERDFPHLGTEDRQEVPDRASSPCLATAVQSLPMGTAGNGWTSALAEVPTIVGSSSVGPPSVPQIVPGSSATLTPSIATGLNMAETLAQAPSRARTAPQVSIETQRLEELAIKQSRQLIPMTPSMSKSLVPSSEKQKPKAGARSDMTVGNKIMQPQQQQQQLSSSHLVNLSVRGGGGPTKSDNAKTSHGGKLLVLKTPRENGILSATKDNSKPTNPAKIASNQLFGAASLPNGMKPASALPANLTSSAEKKASISQAKSRNDFFNLMRKKTSTNVSSGGTVATPCTSTTIIKESGEAAAVSPVSDFSIVQWSAGNGAEGGKHSGCDGIVYPDEEEAAFLRSLGWEENAGEEEGLTEEEINGFYQEYVKLRPSSMRQVKKLSLLCGGSTTTSSNSKSEA